MILEVLTAGKKLPGSHVSQVTGKFMLLLSVLQNLILHFIFFKYVGPDP